MQFLYFKRVTQLAMIKDIGEWKHVYKQPIIQLNDGVEMGLYPGGSFY